jgi:uncharacterized membrane protein YoaT (DUF817 family)
MRPKILLLLQVPALLAIIAFVPTNLGKLVALMVLWALTFRRTSKVELVFCLCMCALFTAMNAASLHQGIFSFSDPDILRMPVYEIFMWGFYLLHIKRLFGNTPKDFKYGPAWALAVAFSASFALVKDPHALTAITASVIAVALILYHERFDFFYLLYFVAFGAAIEYVGVHSGQWSYPDPPPGGVPLWFATLWGGVGLLMRRCMMPLLARFENPNHSTTVPVSRDN